MEPRLDPSARLRQKEPAPNRRIPGGPALADPPSTPAHEITAAATPPEPLTLGPAEPIDLHDVFLYHKTTQRTVYERARASRPDAEAVILWNTFGEVTEGADFNVVVEIDGIKVTPPIECGLLPGTFRAQLLDDGEIVERRITVDQLRAASGGWLINSVRGWVPFTL